MNRVNPITTMNPSTLRLALLGLAAAFLLHPSTLFAQGALTPPGAPAPLFKTLEQVYQKADQAEARVEVQTLPGDGGAKHAITQPGSYYLGSNLVGTAGLNGIHIKTNDVTIDLNGFTMVGVSNQAAIQSTVGGLQRVRIANGRLSGWSSGVDLFTAGAVSNVVVADLTINFIGASFANGIIAQGGLQVLRCVIQGVNGTSSAGISGGDRSVVDSCQLWRTGGGILVGNNSIVRNCQVVDCVGGTGINGTIGSLITDNIVRGSEGIRVSGGSVAERNLVQASVGNGLRLSGHGNRAENNQLVGNTASGVQTDGATSNNVVIRNFASGNTTANYNFLGATVAGPLITNLSGAITNLNPWANFSH